MKGTTNLRAPVEIRTGHFSLPLEPTCSIGRKGTGKVLRSDGKQYPLCNMRFTDTLAGSRRRREFDMWDAEDFCSHTKDEADEGEAGAQILKPTVESGW
jgi:hypothetical protein